MLRLLFVFIFCLVLSDIKSQSLTAAPNPFLHRTQLSFTLNTADTISLVVYDLSGHNIVTIYTNTPKPAGTHKDSLNMDGFGPGVYISSLTMKHGSNQVLKLFKEGIIGIFESNNTPDLEIFPNPVSSKLFVRCPAGINEADLILSDASGRILRTSTKASELEMEEFEPGLYFLRVLGGGYCSSYRIIKE